MNWWRTWWRQPDNFDWLTGYLQTRGLSVITRRSMAAVTATTLIFVPANVAWGPVTIDRDLALVLASVVAVAGLTMAVWWWTRWPTRRQSIAFAVLSGLTIGAGCLWQPNPVAALMGCTALAIWGGYIALFHTAPYAMANFALAMTVALIEATRVAAAGQPMAAASGIVLVAELNVAVPFAVQSMVRALSIDLRHSDRDPLTGLLNRRALSKAGIGRILTASNTSHLAVAMVDLDRFKAINDSLGHAAGDAALVAVADALRASCRDTTLIGRIGGEEFLLLDVFSAPAPFEFGERVCDAVAASPPPVTASVGTSTVALREVATECPDELFRHLMHSADAAMYVAKRRGGNQAHHRGVLHQH